MAPPVEIKTDGNDLLVIYKVDMHSTHQLYPCHRSPGACAEIDRVHSLHYTNYRSSIKVT